MNENINNSNLQDVFLRNATISVVDLLNRKVNLDLIRNDKVENYTVPFFYNFGGDEGFLKDFFSNLPEDCKIPKAEGNYDIIPRGNVTFKTFNIRTSDITNKFVRGSFNKETRNENNEKVVKAYSANLFVVPMTLRFDIKILNDNLNKTFKIMQNILDLYFKNNVIYFQYRGIRIPGQIVFPDSHEQDKKYEFDYTTNNKVTTTFSVDMETYYPSFDTNTIMYKGNIIRQFNQLIKDKSGISFTENWIDKDFPPTE